MKYLVMAKIVNALVLMVALAFAHSIIDSSVLFALFTLIALSLWIVVDTLSQRLQVDVTNGSDILTLDVNELGYEDQELTDPIDYRVNGIASDDIPSIEDAEQQLHQIQAELTTLQDQYSTDSWNDMMGIMPSKFGPAKS